MCHGHVFLACRGPAAMQVAPKHARRPSLTWDTSYLAHTERDRCPSHGTCQLVTFHSHFVKTTRSCGCSLDPDTRSVIIVVDWLASGNKTDRAIAMVA